MPQTCRKGSCYLLAVHLLGLNTVLFYAYDGHFYLALSTFSMLAIDGSIFLNLRWIPHGSLSESRIPVKQAGSLIVRESPFVHSLRACGHVASLWRPCLLVSCTPLHNIRYGITFLISFGKFCISSLAAHERLTVTTHPTFTCEQIEAFLKLLS